ncbi:MAG: hypothetical protein UDG86_13545 [Lachnospiraceae bacterium]|jgi:energy-coupling factor transport system substrate-specific component|nr:hypothetical protein [Lachnospiraceae bacterium]
MKTRELVTMAFLTAIMFVGQVGMAFLPNIEIVSLLVILYTQLYRKKVFLIIYLFAFLEGVIYGFGIWWINYLYIWSILAVVVLLVPKKQPVPVWAVISGIYGLSYGFLCAIPYYITGGAGAGFSYWVTGIPFDILHCVGNVGVTLVLYKPVSAILRRLTDLQRTGMKNNF